MPYIPAVTLDPFTASSETSVYFNLTQTIAYHNYFTVIIGWLLAIHHYWLLAIHHYWLLAIHHYWLLGMHFLFSVVQNYHWDMNNVCLVSYLDPNVRKHYRLHVRWVWPTRRRKLLSDIPRTVECDNF